jgi:biopolymer transport protein ExbB
VTKTPILWLLVLLLGLCPPAAWAEAAPAAERSEPSAQQPAPPAAAPEPSEPPQSFLGWLARSLGAGWVAVFLLLTVNLVAVVVMNVLAVWRPHVVPPPLIRGLEARIDQQRYQEACDLAKGDPSLLGQVLAAGMAEISDGYVAALAAMQEAAQLLALKMRQRLGYLMLIATLAVLLGAAGTFYGMSSFFDAAARLGADPSQLLRGIASALLATMVGLWIAVAAVLAHHVLRNRMNQLIAEVGILSERLLKRLADAQGA